MHITKHDKWVFGLLLVVFTMTMVSGYMNGGMQKLFRHDSLQGKNAAQQRAVDHIFGSDRVFDPSADNITNSASAHADSVSWKTLAYARINPAKHDSSLPTIIFSRKIQQLDSHEVTITGYMFPLEATSDQSHFLLSAYAPSCPYCLPGGPTELIEIIDSEPLKFTYEPITVHGEFHLLHDAAIKEGMFYRMTKVKLQQS